MSTSALTKSDMRSIIVNLSNVDLHECLADASVSSNLAPETVTMLRDEAHSRGLL